MLNLLTLATASRAQSGDREGEVQKPPPAHWDIPPAPALSVEEALQTFQVADGFRIEVVAADPLIFDPVAMQIGPDGRIWVVEMRGYMPNVDGEGEDAPIGTIAVLSDTDGDGRMDARTEFASGLVLPRALALVADGALVAEPPHLWFMRDTDGDGRADERTAVATDYGNTANPEHSANGLLPSLNNWLTNANHHARYRYDRGTWITEPAPDRGQWGITQDDSGRFYYNTNSNPLRADLLPGEFLLRNPDLPATGAINFDVAPRQDLTLFPSRITPGINRGYQILGDDGVLREVTAACAPLIYRGSAFPADFYGNAFVAEPAAHLVKRILLAPTADGALRGTNAYPASEFLTSTDERFRPVNLTNGPDGALYVVDMYRGIIQHRIFVTSYLRAQIIERQLETPLGMGRIYRIVPADTPSAPTPTPTLHTASPAELVAALGRLDAWWRETAQRLLVERADPDVAPALRDLLRDPTHPGRLHALWILDALDALPNDALLTALRDPAAPLRLNALQIAAHRLAADPGNELLIKAVLAAATAPEPEVRRQAALAIGNTSDDIALPALAGLAQRDGAIAAMPAAIVSGLPRRELAWLREVAAADSTGAADPVIALAAATIIERKDPAELTGVLAFFETIDATDHPDFLSALLSGFERHTRGRRGSGAARLRLPVEPTALIRYATTAPAAHHERVATLLAHIDGPAAATNEAPPLTPAEQARYAQGQALYAVCAGCHQLNGRGMDGLAPSLVGSRWATAADPELTAALVLHGKQGEQLTMPPLAALNDDTLAAILTYVRRSWGNQASPVTPAHIAAARQQHADRTTPWTDPELQKLEAKD